MKRQNFLRSLWLWALVMVTGSVGAQNVAKIGATEYASLSDAFGAAADGSTITLLKDASLKGAQSLGTKSVTITAEDKITKLSIGDALTQMQNAKVKFVNLTVENNSKTTYRGFQTSSLTFDGCNLNGEIWTYANDFTCKDCTFTQSQATSGNRYSLYVYGSKKVTLTDCTFNVEGKAVKIAKDGDTSPVTLVANGCTFNSTIVNKNVFMYDTRYSQIAVIATDCEFDDNFKSSSCEFGARICADEYTINGGSKYAGYGAVGTDIVVNEDGKIVSGHLTEVTPNIRDIFAENSELKNNEDGSYTVYVAPDLTITNINELVAFEQAVNAGNTYAGKVVVLDNDIDLAGVAWKPIGNVTSYPGITFAGTFDGQNHTISNMTTSDDLPNYATAGFFGSSKGTIKNLTLTNVKVTSTHYAAGLCGYTSNDLKIENCKVVGGTITSTPEWLGSEYDNGDKVGGILGYGVAATEINGCAVENITVTAYRDLGGIAGCTAGKVENCSAKDCAIVQDLKNGYKESAPTTYAAIVGRNTGSAENLTNNTETNVEVKSITSVDVVSVEVSEDVTVEGATTEAEKEAANKVVEELGKNANVTSDEASNVSEAEDVTTLAITVKEVSVNIEQSKATITKVTYDVQPMNEETPVSETAQPITFRLPVPQSFKSAIVNVKHDHNGNIEEFSAFVKGEGAKKYVELSSDKFSEWTIEDVLGANLEIKTANDLVQLATYVNAGHDLAGKTVKLANDVDMTSVANFAPINNFSGTFDGQDHTISNLNVSANTNYAGLFGHVYSATIMNVKLAGATVENTGENYTALLAGGGYVRIENCEISGGSVTGTDQVGAVIGYLSCGYVKNCTVDGVTVTANGDRAGGLVGKANVDSEYDIVGNTVKNSTIVATKKIGEMRSAAGLVGQVMASASNHWTITDNKVINVTTKTDNDETFVPVGEFRKDNFQANAVTTGHIVRNHWEPATTPDSYNMVNPNDASQYVTIENYSIAKIGTKGYMTLEDAIAAVTTGQTIQMCDNYQASAMIEVPASKNFNLDLNGKTISPAAGTKINGGLVGIHNGATLNITDKSATPGKITTGNEQVYAAVQVTVKGDTDTGTAKLTANNVTLEGMYYGITGNGSRHNTAINLTKVTVNVLSDEGTAIYHPQSGKLVINSGTFNGKETAVEVRAGELTIFGGTFNIEATEFSAQANGNGTTVTGAAIAVSQHSTDKDINVTIKGGTFNGIYALYEKDFQNGESENITMNITAGAFNGKVEAVDVKKFIAGGSYKEVVPAEYCATGFVPVSTPNSNGYYKVEEITEENAGMVIVDKDETKTFYSPLDVEENAVELVDGISSIRVNNDIVTPGITYKRTFTKSFGTWQSWFAPIETVVGADEDAPKFAKLVQFAYVDANNKIVTDLSQGTGDLVVVVRKLAAGDEVHPNLPYFVKVPESGEYTFESSDDVLYKTTPKDIEVSTAEKKFTFKGVYTAEEHTDIWMLATNGGYSHMTSAKTVNPYRWYFSIEDNDIYADPTPAPANFRVVTIGEDALATAIMNAVAEQQNVAPAYDLSGRQVQSVKSGLYIQGGKKIMK